MKYLSFKPLELTNTVSNANSSAFDLSQIYRLSVQIVVGAGTTMSGSVQLQVSNDEIETFYLHKETPTHWSNLGTATSLSAANTNYLIISQDVCYRSMRVVFTGNGGNNCPVTVQIMAQAF